MKKRRWNEIRLDEDGNPDDIVISCDSIHLERMDNNFWWLGINKNGERTTFEIGATLEGIMTELVENGLKTETLKWKK